MPEIAMAEWQKQDLERLVDGQWAGGSHCIHKWEDKEAESSARTKKLMWRIPSWTKWSWVLLPNDRVMESSSGASTSPRCITILFYSPLSPSLNMGLSHHCHILTTVNIRPFYLEAKQSKRYPTNQQLKILEATFQSNVKPCVKIRQKLASEINMAPRSVQVCLCFSSHPQCWHSFCATGVVSESVQ
jgi:hypothetical protein